MKDKKSEDKIKPKQKVQDGAYEATVWENNGSNGAFETIQLQKSWKDEKKGWQHSRVNFPKADKEKVIELLKQIK